MLKLSIVFIVLVVIIAVSVFSFGRDYDCFLGEKMPLYDYKLKTIFCVLEPLSISLKKSLFIGVYFFTLGTVLGKGVITQIRSVSTIIIRMFIAKASSHFYCYRALRQKEQEERFKTN